MQMPSRSQYHSGQEFLAALDGWIALSEASYHALRGMYDVTEATTSKPAWLSDFARGDRKPGDAIIHVSLDRAPSGNNLEPLLRNLAGRAMHEGKTITRICHGIFDGIWGCYAYLGELAINPLDHEQTK